MFQEEGVVLESDPPEFRKEGDHCGKWFLGAPRGVVQ